MGVSEQMVKVGFAVIGVLVVVLGTTALTLYQTTQRLRADVTRLEAEVAAASVDGNAGGDSESGSLQELLEGGVSAEELLRELGSAENRDALEGLLEDQGLLDRDALEGLLDRDAFEGLLDRDSLEGLLDRDALEGLLDGEGLDALTTPAPSPDR